MSGPAPVCPLAGRREGLPAGHRERLLPGVPCPVLQPPPPPPWKATASSAAAILEPSPCPSCHLGHRCPTQRTRLGVLWRLRAMSGTKRARGDDCPIVGGKRELGAPEAKRRRGPAMTIKRRRGRRVRFHRTWTSSVSTSRRAHGGGSACGIAGLAPHHRARPRIGAVTAPPSLVQALGSLPAARPPPPALAGWHYLTSGPPLAPSSAGPQSPLSPVLSPSPFLLLMLVFSLVLVVGVGCCLYFRVR